MGAWLDAFPGVQVQALAAASAVLLLLCLFLLVAWLKARAGRRAQWFDRVDSEQERLDLELALAEQTARLRIIRELHEMAIHSVSMMISQAEGVRYSGGDSAAAARSAGVIADSARSTLADLRRVMTVVREGEADATPQVRLQPTEDLFAVMRDAGLSITFEESGERFELNPGAQLAVHRILQDTLANSLKHGGPGTDVGVSFTWTAEGFCVLVVDDGVQARNRNAGIDPTAPAAHRGYSIDDDLAALTEIVSGAAFTEMRSRAALFGGVVDAHPVPGVGFYVAAMFPALRHHNGVHGVSLEGR